MEKVKAYFEITRPLNLIITFSVVLISAIICSGKLNLHAPVLLACISASMVAASGNLINDYFDIEIDKINRPDRPLPSKRLSQKEVIIFYVLTVIISVVISFQISLPAAIIAAVTVILLFIYSFRLKSVPLIGNLTVSVCTGLAFIYGGIAVNNYNDALIPAVFAILINLIRELIKDIEDLDGDRKNGQSTFPIKYGIGQTKKLIFLFVILLIFATFYPFITRLYKIEYFLIVLFLVDLPLIYFIIIIYSKDFLTKLSLISFRLKILMIIGLIAIFIGKY